MWDVADVFWFVYVVSIRCDHVQLAAANPNGDDDDGGVLGAAEATSTTEATVADSAQATDVTTIVVQPDNLVDDDA